MINILFQNSAPYDSLIEVRRLKDLSRVKPSFESIPLQLYFEIAGLSSVVKWREIQNIDEEERF